MIWFIFGLIVGAIAIYLHKTNNYIVTKKTVFMEEIYIPEVKMSTEEVEMINHYMVTCGADSKYVQYTIIHIMDQKIDQMWENVGFTNETLVQLEGFQETTSKRLSNVRLSADKMIQYENIKQQAINRANTINDNERTKSQN